MLNALAHDARRLAAVALLSLSTLAAACGGSDSATGPSIGDTPRSEVPEELVGDWLYGSISPTNFWNDHTGQYAGNAYGFSDYWQLDEDGSFQRYIYIYTQNYGCRTQVWTHMQGTVVVSSGSLAAYPQRGDYKVADTCVSRNNYRRAMTRDELLDKQGDEFDYGFDVLNGQLWLLMAPSGTGSVAHYKPM
jgi:hypothetical protein